MIDTIRPFGDRVLVRRKKVEDKTAGGIIIPDTAQEKSQWGIVVAVSTGKTTKEGNSIPLSVKAGDDILFGKYAGTEIDSEHLILREEEILGVRENK